MPTLISQKHLICKDEKGKIINYKLLEKKVNLGFTPFNGLTIRDEFGYVHNFREHNFCEYYVPEDALYVVFQEYFNDENSRDEIAKMWISQGWGLVTSPKFRKKFNTHCPAYPSDNGNYVFENESYSPVIVAHK